MIDFKKDLIKKFLEETQYMCFDDKTISQINTYNNKITFLLCELSENKNIVATKSMEISIFDIMGWFLNKIELKDK